MNSILLITGHYLPGYKAGGPIRSVSNLVEWLGDEMEFRILTSDRDLGDRGSYPGIIANTWQHFGKAKVFYFSSCQLQIPAWRKLLKRIPCDLVYLNSFFSPQTIYVLFMRRIRQIPDWPIVLAPRGEFSPGALGVKKFKKKFYMALAIRMKFFNGITWQATNEHEKADILTTLEKYVTNIRSRIHVAPNLASRARVASVHPGYPPKQVDKIRLVFLSRICRMKNLDFALDLLTGLEGDIEFDIFGPIEDQKLWQECQKNIKNLSANIRVTYKGNLQPDKIIERLSAYHLMLFPTRGENFGHVIFESLLAGCPVLISDQTPWRNLAMEGAGWDLPLSDPDSFRGALRQCIKMDESEFQTMAFCAYKAASVFIKHQSMTALQAYRNLFDFALSE